MGSCRLCGLALTQVVREATRQREAVCVCCDPSLQGARADCRHRPDPAQTGLIQSTTRRPTG